MAPNTLSTAERVDPPDIGDTVTTASPSGAVRVRAGRRRWTLHEAGWRNVKPWPRYRSCDMDVIAGEAVPSSVIAARPTTSSWTGPGVSRMTAKATAATNAMTVITTSAVCVPLISGSIGRSDPRGDLHGPFPGP